MFIVYYKYACMSCRKDFPSAKPKSDPTKVNLHFYNRYDVPQYFTKRYL